MLRVDVEKWDQSLEDLHREAFKAAHPRTRERYLALFEIARGSYPTQLAEPLERHPQTIMRWVHVYNTQGPEALAYRHSGGHPPFPRKSNRQWTKSLPPV